MVEDRREQVQNMTIQSMNRIWSRYSAAFFSEGMWSNDLLVFGDELKT